MSAIRKSQQGREDARGGSHQGSHRETPPTGTGGTPTGTSGTNRPEPAATSTGTGGTPTGTGGTTRTMPAGTTGPGMPSEHPTCHSRDRMPDRPPPGVPRNGCPAESAVHGARRLGDARRIGDAVVAAGLERSGLGV